MGVKMFRADRVFDGTRFLEKGTVVVMNEQGEVVDLTQPGAAGSDVQHLPGILLPGLVNAHCHLELSHFKGSMAEKKGLPAFLLEVVSKRREAQDPEWVQAQIRAAAAEMHRNGIAGVGDICNTADAIAVKKESPLRWRNFIEVLNFTDAALQDRLLHNQKILESHLAAGLADSCLTAHAPYSVTAAAFKAINAATTNSIVSVHNQETSAEDELFEQGTGPLLQLYSLTGTPPPGPTGKSSLQTWLPYFTQGQTVVLVHNTDTQKKDLQFAKAHAALHGLKLVWCLCPGANKYIEDKLPPLDLLLEENCIIALGTDSYSSNWQLSIAAEIRLLTLAYPQVPLEALLQAATRNGAEALGFCHLGKLEKGKTPGLALLHTDARGAVTGTSERVA